MMQSERIRIYPASRAQMESVIAAEQDDELKKAYELNSDYRYNEKGDKIENKGKTQSQDSQAPNDDE